MKDNRPLTAIETGEQDCSDMHSCCSVRNTYILHYICRGKGVLSVKGRDYPLNAGQIFFIRPGELTGYRPDQDDPYHYKWVCFDGSVAAQLAEATGFATLPVSPVMPQAEPLFDRLIQADDRTSPCNAELLRLLSLIIEVYPAASSLPAMHELATLARDYIFANLHRPELRVQQVADRIGVSRSFLYRIFTKHYGQSPMSFIEEKRMNNAKRMLKSDCSVSLVAASSGYEDALYFSTSFKKAVGMSPSKFRAQNEI